MALLGCSGSIFWTAAHETTKTHNACVELRWTNCCWRRFSRLVTGEDILSTGSFWAVTNPGYAGGPIFEQPGPQAVTMAGYVYPGAVTATDLLGCH